MNAVQSLLSAAADDSWGGIAPSVYETARLVSLAPHLDGHHARLRFLLDSQNDDGSWATPDLYRVVPTLSAVEALLACLQRDDAGQDPAEIAVAVRRGLLTAKVMLRDARPLPDTAAVDVVVPGLVVDINEQLRSGRLPITPGPPLPLPRGMDTGTVLRLRQLARSGARLPEKTWYVLETVGTAARGIPGAPSGSGNISASPAATAAWLPVRHSPDDPCGHYLAAVRAHYGEAVPVATPVDVFERSWVLGSLLRARVPAKPDRTMVRRLASTLGPQGTGTGAGLPEDSDSTSGVIYALAKLGVKVDADCLLTYDTGSHLRTYHVERNASVTANAHALEAFDAIIDRRPVLRRRYTAVCRRITKYLLETQQPDGHWDDKWHASPFYATFCCVTALCAASASRERGAREAVERALGWVLSAQHASGGWGWWGDTAEETAYAVQTLLLGTSRSLGVAITELAISGAVGRGTVALTELARIPAPALWIAKDLYGCDRVVEAAVLAATHLTTLALRGTRSDIDRPA